MRLQQANQLSFGLSICIFGSVLAGSVGTYLLLATAPRDIGPLGVTIWFLCFFIGMSCALTLVRYWIRVRLLANEEKLRAFKRLVRQDITWILFATVALAMQSLRVLNIGDGLLFLLALGIIEVYFRTRQKQ